MRHLGQMVSVAIAVLVFQGAAQAAEPLPDSYQLRVSGLSHNIEPHGDEHGFADIGGSIMFPKISTSLTGASALLVPRFHVGGTASLASKTSFAYAGVTWSVPFADVYFASLDFGGAVNNGEPNGAPDRSVAMGCHATFRESAAIGRSITSNISIAATIEHFSNANLCDHNSGITNAGIMIGYKF